MSVLKLGNFDQTASQAEVNSYFNATHDTSMRKQCRGEKDDEWFSMTQVPGSGVKELQLALRDFGFMPHGSINGIFGYRTMSAARLFQEYVRSIEGHRDMEPPDGVVGPKTQAHIRRWAAAGQKADWAGAGPQNPTPEFTYWLEALRLFKRVNETTPVSKVISMVSNFAGASDSVKVSDWKFDPEDVHLVGIRRKENFSANKRSNDDIFVLLVNGLVFKFYGSTDPCPTISGRADEPYIVRGQHEYRFGWHLLGKQQRCYRAFEPATAGVLVCRDLQNDNAFTDTDLTRLSVNNTINIHWSGSGTSNWSAGCQVVAGARYINHRNQKIDCSSFAAVNYSQLPGKTRGAYNVLVDLVTAFAPSPVMTSGTKLLYTLVDEEDLSVQVDGGQTITQQALSSVQGVAPEVLARNTSINQLVAQLL